MKLRAPTPKNPFLVWGRALFLFFVLTLVLPAVASAQLNANTTTTSTSSATSTKPQTPPKPACALSVSPGAVYVGDTVMLAWSSRDATGGTITSLGAVGPSGRQGVIPTANNSTFVGTFTGPGGTGTCSIAVGIIRGSGGGLNSGSTGAGTTGGSNGSSQFTTGTGLIPCNGVDCQACDLATLGQRIINWLVGISIPLAAAMFAYAGIIYFTSGVEGDWNKKSRAHSIFKSVGIGFVIVLCAWLGVQTILKTILAPGFYKSWNSIQCVDENRRPTNKTVQDALNAIPFLSSLSTKVPATSLTPAYYNQPGGPQLVAPPGGGCDAGLGICWDENNVVVAAQSGSIANAAALYYGTDTSLGPDEGNKACAWAVNNVLTSAGVPTIDGDSVALMEQELNNGRGTLSGSNFDTSNTSAGDIVVWKNNSISHVGICQNDGCSKVISNSSGSATFTTITDAGFNKGVESRIYRVNK